VTLSETECFAVKRLDSFYSEQFLSNKIESMHPLANINNESEIIFSGAHGSALLCTLVRTITIHIIGLTLRWQETHAPYLLESRWLPWPNAGVGAVLYLRGRLEPGPNSGKEQLRPVIDDR
jgi:hypothetical protein